MALLLIAQGATARDVCVTPSTQVVSNVVLRDGAAVTSSALAHLQPSEEVRLFGEVPEWYRVQLSTGKEAFIAKQWTRVRDCEAPTESLSRAFAAALPSAVEVFEIHVIDVGTGLSILVRGHDFALLYDGGSNDDKGQHNDNRLLAYLAQFAPDLHRIDHVILSHPHQDHVLLLADVLEKYEVGDVWNSGAFAPICGYRSFIKAIAQRTGVTYHTALLDFGTEQVAFEQGCQSPAETVALRHGARIGTDVIPLGEDASMQFLYVDGSHRSDPNDNSLVLRMTLGDHVFLLMGDAGAGGRELPSSVPKPKSVEGILLGCCKLQLKADILAVGHHGSLTSSRTQFLDAVQAKVFLVSSGPFLYSGTGLPDAETIDELKRRGALWRTDVDDDACRTSQHKVGPPGDNKVGGCNNVLIRLTPQSIDAAYQPTP